MPYDNAVAESFFAAMKIEELSHHFYNELAELKRDVDEYIAFFNEKRLHGKLNYKTPNQIWRIGLALSKIGRRKRHPNQW